MFLGSDNIKRLFIGTVFALCVLFTAQMNAESYQMHSVKKGETYYQIANLYGANGDVLQKTNNQTSESLKIGSLIKVKQIKDITVKVNGQAVKFDVQPYIEREHVFVPIRFVTDALKYDSIDWKQETKTATVQAGNKNIVVKVGSDTASVNGKAVKLDAPVQFYDSRTFVPIRFFSEVIGVDSINWDSDSYTVDIKKGVQEANNEDNSKYSEEDLYWLSRIVEVEAGSEPFESKVGVANVIINRKNSPQFPNSIKGVIFDTKYGTQFPTAVDGSINKKPSEESISAAKKALEGYNNVGASLYFANISIKDSWVAKNRKYFITIGNHAYYL